MSDCEAPLTLGTAGHIDHGKTALITLLTGKNTDRLREERERGISIELGYAELELPTGRRLSVIDVPGHERFVRTMVAGATGIDLFLLVIAADDGVMPQTVEHVAILDLLGVRHGVVALTKADLVDDELLELARADVVEFLAAGPYSGAPVVTVSARDGRGVPELIGALEAASAEVERARRDGPARLPVDRVFPLKGIGTVVTGTLWRGEIKAGDALVVQPGGERVTVRSVQVHDHPAEVAHAGNRVGINVRGVEKDQIERGRWLVAPAAASTPTSAFDAWIELLPSARALKSGSAVRLHHGTAQFVARVTVVEGKEIAAGGEGAAIVRLDASAAVEPHDRFILRSLSPVATIGGGVVLDAVPRRWHARGVRALFLAALHEGDTARAAPALAAARAELGLGAADLAGIGLAAAAAAEVLDAAEARGELESLSGPGGGERRDVTVRRWFVPGTLAKLRAALAQALARRAHERPDRPFVTLAELATATPGLAAAQIVALLAALPDGARVVEDEGGYALEGAGGALGPAQERLAAAVLERMTREPFAPPTLAALAEQLGAERRSLTTVLEVLVRRGELVRVKEDLWFARVAVDAARERLLAALAHSGQITLAEFRDLVDTGRRNAQALLESFDREGLTRRRGDVRVPRTRRP